MLVWFFLGYIEGESVGNFEEIFVSFVFIREEGVRNSIDY